MTLESNITEVRGVGDELAKLLKKLGITTVAELIDYLPRRYDDYSHVEPISRIKPGVVTVEAVIKQAKGRYMRRGMHITEAIGSDDTGSVRLIWFNQPYRETSLKKGASYYISGDFQLRRQHLSIMNPSVELVSDFPVNTARIIPIYRETKGLKSAQIRKLIRETLPHIRSLAETLPAWVIRKQSLEPRSHAYEMMHFPDDAEALEKAKRRLGFEEVFRLSLASLLNKHELLQEKALAIPFEENLAKEFVSHLPFRLTDDQRRTTWQIYLDMQKTQPMNRLVNGDVGSGKTVVATMAAVMAMKEGFQVALMAPTELLARQHAGTIHELLTPLGLEHRLSLLIGSLGPKQKKTAHERIKSGDAQFLVGTHALIQEKVDMHKLGLIIIDEQHRFGVEQRRTLQKKAGHMPHVLSLTATPIPRSLALTLYGELDISVIGSKPPGRLPIKTKLCSPNSRKQLYDEVDQQIKEGRQVFVVCPLITESEFLDARSVEEVYEQISGKDFKSRRVGLLHGKMRSEDKEAVMRRFVKHELDILVATTVVEVGVNVPNASVMLIENAERFGLAQIHQLRGRIGRSSQQGYCYLMMGDSSAPSRRLKVLESSSDGFKLAELDLELRGPGAIYGTSQHGELDLRIAKLSDVALIAQARKTAQEFIDKQENLLNYKELHESVSKLRAVTNLN